ncbi:MAG: hypothetical protein EP329_10195 [Deltaproteobacteria bacterium]|nr:MAG: hypothetical protein EP329_10195 [Deltaproteobacteria bacterium]
MRCDDLDALAKWAEDEGGLLDEVVWLAVEPGPGGDGWRLVLATPLVTPPPTDPRAAFAAASTPARRWTLTPRGAGEAPTPSLPAEVGGIWSLEAGGAGVALDLGATVVEIAATGWEAEVGPEIALPVARTLDPLELTFHGPGPCRSAALTAATAAAGMPIALHRNWAGSGQRFGAALTKDALLPEPVGGDEALAGAWRVVPAGLAADDPRGVWLTGQSLVSAAYVTLHRAEASDPALVAALTRALRGLDGLDWACSGSALVEAEGFDAWLSSLEG